MTWDLAQAFPVTLAQTQDVTPEAPPTDATGGGETTGRSVEDQTLDNADGNGGGANPFGGMLPIILLLFVVMMIFMMGGQRKEKKRRAEMLSKLAKGDKVQTVGGMLGTVVEVRDDRVIVKIDENTNTRVAFSRAAVQNVITDGEVDNSEKR